MGVGALAKAWVVEHRDEIRLEPVQVSERVKESGPKPGNEILHDADGGANHRSTAGDRFDRDDTELFVLRGEQDDIRQLIVPCDLTPIGDRAGEHHRALKPETLDSAIQRVTFSLMRIAHHDESESSTLLKQSPDHLQAVEGPLGRHDLADKEQDSFVVEVQGPAQVADIIVLLEQAGVHAERNNRVIW